MINIRPRRRESAALRACAAIGLAGGVSGVGILAMAGCSTPSTDQRAAVAKQEMCSACHGRDGNSQSARAPILAGQSKAYLSAQLGAFRDHSRGDQGARFFMWPMAASLDDAAIDRLAGYFSALAPLPGEAASGKAASGAAASSTAVTAQITAGKSIFEQGIPARGVAACASCHGEKGQGLTVFPRLAGQHADYLAAQLAAFADESRANPIMGPMAKPLSAQEMGSVAAYLAAL